MSKTLQSMTGYKATDKDMKCRGFQFELGKWYEAEGELVECENGFHFCDYPSGPWQYYSEKGTRIFKVEAEEVLDTQYEPGATRKRVCRRIRLVEEVEVGGHWNTGHRNTGHGNTGDWNTGHRNTGHGNTGDWNTGDGNTGNGNTGDWNTGHRNTGNGNTGHGNTGNGNATDRSAGFFNRRPQTVIVFDKDSGLTRGEFLEQFPQAYDLGELLMKDEPIDYERFKGIPGITEKKLRKLHEKFIAARQEASK